MRPLFFAPYQAGCTGAECLSAASAAAVHGIILRLAGAGEGGHMKKHGGMMYPVTKTTKAVKNLSCHKCGKELTPSTAFHYVDSCNCAITRNAPPFCLSCYKATYGR